MKRKLITLIDSVGRYIVGEFLNQTETSITLKTPIILNIQPDQNSGKLHIQNFPLFFKEFLQPGSQNTWTFAKNSIVLGDLELDDRLASQYESMAHPPEPGNVKSTNSGAPVIKLFED